MKYLCKETMTDWLERTGLLLSEEALDKLKRAHVAVFGIGGVGGYVTEALARSGIGSFTLIDNDTVSLSNINRQIIATVDSVGKYKTDVMKERILSINPMAEVKVSHCFFLPDTQADFLPLNQYSYVVDAIDTVSAKIALALKAQEESFPLISSMGTGNKLDPTRFEVADIYETSVCPLAKVMRRELKTRGVKHLKVVYSKEEPIKPLLQISEGSRRSIPGSISFVPSVVGLIIAGEIVKDLVK